MSDTTTRSSRLAGSAALREQPQRARRRALRPAQEAVHEIRETALTIAVFIPFWLVFSTFVYELRSIPSESMVPALQVGDRVAVAKFAYGYDRNSVPFGFGTLFMGDDKKKPDERIFGSTPKRGDVVVFQHPLQSARDDQARGRPARRHDRDEGRTSLPQRRGGDAHRSAAHALCRRRAARR